MKKCLIKICIYIKNLFYKKKIIVSAPHTTNKIDMNLENLLGKGFFPVELPPAFNTLDFAKKYATLQSNLSGARGKKATRLINFSIPKNGLFRKILSVPNPIHQSELCEVIAKPDNWKEIEKIYSVSKFSFSRPLLTSQSSSIRATKILPFGEFIKAIFLDSHSYRYQLKADITRYYPSIYTHSISWAFYTKDVAKISKDDKNLTGNLLDKCVQYTNYAQTNGIPIGPDTSLIISEIIGCKIDEELQNFFPNLKGFRYIDDMFFFFDSIGHAEECLLKLQEITKKFELQLNVEKTKISKLPKGFEPEWKMRLLTFEFRETEKKQYNDLIAYFSLCFDFCNLYPDDHVLIYAIKRIKDIEMLSNSNFDLLETMLLKGLMSSPNTMNIVFSIFLQNKDRVKKDKISKVIFEIIKQGCLKGFDYEVVWALWIAKTFAIKIPDSIASILSSSSDTFTILLTLDMVELNLIDKKGLDTSVWELDLKEESLYNEKWLFAYEVGVKKWLKGNFDYIDKVPFFKILKKHKVSFYDSKRQLIIKQATSKPSQVNVVDTNENQHISDYNNIFELFKLLNYDDGQEIIDEDTTISKHGLEEEEMNKLLPT